MQLGPTSIFYARPSYSTLLSNHSRDFSGCSGHFPRCGLGQLDFGAVLVPQNGCFWCETEGSGCNSWSFRFFPDAPATLLHSPTTPAASQAVLGTFHGVVQCSWVLVVLAGFWCGFGVSKLVFLVRNGGNGCNSWSFRFFPNAPATLLHSRTTLPALCALSSKFHGVVPLTGVYGFVGVFVRIQGGFRARKHSPKHSKTSSPVRIRFFREGRRPEVCSERGVCHPHKVSGEFHGVVPRPLIPTQTTNFGAKTR